MSDTPPPTNSEKTYWLDKPGNIRKLIIGIIIVCVLLVLSDLMYVRKSKYAIEGWVGFYGFFGFIAFTGIVLVGKYLRRILMRDENYYDKDFGDE